MNSTTDLELDPTRPPDADLIPAGQLMYAPFTGEPVQVAVTVVICECGALVELTDPKAPRQCERCFDQMVDEREGVG